MKKIKKLFKVIFIISIFIVSFFAVGSVTYYNVVTNGISLETDKLKIENQNSTLSIFDSNQNEIKPTSASYIKLSKLSSHTKDAFLCAEDKRFYKHKGLDFIRIGGAIISNLKTRSFSEGASTISQQLVKNTQLSNEKTISRKLKEIKLTKELEDNYTKDEIFELYLNNIYFGNGCYGVQNASKHYFNKDASSLSIAESAILAGSINAPSIFDIENNQEKAIKRRNLILSQMKKYKKISETEFNDAIAEKVNLNLNSISGNNQLYSNIVNEVTKILNTNENNLKNSNYKIYTSIDTNLSNQIKKINSNYNLDAEIVNIVIDNKTHQIIAYNGKNNIISKKWQPGSTIKPILVYAPAIEKEIISPSTKILDEKINISGYCPDNADKKYHGYISAKTALSKSYNIPAVKILNEVGITEATAFAKKLGIEFDKNDNNLAIALGGFTNGITPKSLCDAYSAFSNYGRFQKSSFITKIVKNGKIIYTNKQNEKNVMNDSTAFLITDMLMESTKTGTSKRLNGLNFQVASKTGTVGKQDSTKNTLAYNISYTTNHTILTMIYSTTLSKNINGSTFPTMISKDVLNNLYKNSTPANFEVPKSVKKIKIDKTEYENNKLVQTENNNYLESYFSKSNLPEKQKNNFELTAINNKNSKPIICFTLNINYDYSLIRTHKKKEEILFSSQEKTQNLIKFIDKTAKCGEIYEYKLKIRNKTDNEEFESNSIKLKAN